MKLIRNYLKRSQRLVRLYQWTIGYDPRAKQWCRVIMDQSTEELVRKMDFGNLAVLEISGRKWENFGFRKYSNVFYPAFDICRDITERKFDLIIAEQVFEHIRKQYQAGVNIYNMLNPGGYFLITTPFLIRIHPSPDDCTRWSKSGIRYFLEECGFKLNDIESYSWGNRRCINANFVDWIPFNRKKHSLENEENFPMVIWAFARKQKEVGRSDHLSKT